MVLQITPPIPTLELQHSRQRSTDATRPLPRASEGIWLLGLSREPQEPLQSTVYSSETRTNGHLLSLPWLVCLLPSRKLAREFHLKF